MDRAEAHYIDSGPYMMVSNDLRIDEFKYQCVRIGNWVVCLPGVRQRIIIWMPIRHDGEEIAHLGGIYLPAEEGTEA